MIKVEQLTKRYGGNFALDDISFTIEEGEIVGLLGPNGAGKSTTMNILTGFLSATNGRALINGVDILEDPEKAKRQIGYLPEQPPVYPDMTVGEYLNFVYELKGCTFDRAPHLAEIMAVVKIADMEKRLIRNLSKGYRQRVGIAATLIGNPPVLIFDEPTVGLDPKQILEVRQLLRTLGKKHTVILSTHILSEVQAVCERVIVISRGRIIANEKTEDMARVIEEDNRYRVSICGDSKEVLAVMQNLSCVRKARLLPERDGEAHTYLLEMHKGNDMRKAIFSACASGGFPLVGFSPVGRELEDVFMALLDKENENKSAKKRGKTRDEEKRGVRR